MKFGMKIRFTDVLQDGTLVNTYIGGRKNGFAFDIRLGYYRGHFLSDIDELHVTVDGERFDDQDVTFAINGKEFGVRQLSELYSEFWQLIEPAHITVRKPGGLEPGEHKVELDMWMRVPYLPLPGGDGDHNYMPLDNCDAKVMVLEEV